MTKYFTKDGDDYVPVEGTLLAQTDVDSVVESRLERERKKFADYDSLKEQAGKVESIKSEYEEKLKSKDTEKSELEKQLGSTKLEVVKVKTLREFKLSDDAAEFITGDTEEDIRKKAEKLSKLPSGSTLKIDKQEKPEEKPNSSRSLAGKLFGKSDD
jgi:hypothetical protein